MTEMNDDEMRQAFFALIAPQNKNAVRKWAQNLVRSLEQQVAAMGAHLHERIETIDRLEEEIQQLNNQSVDKSTSQEPDEDRHQRHRRERMLDQVTLICVRDGIERMNSESTAEYDWGQMSREAAKNICEGLNDVDAKQ